MFQNLMSVMDGTLPRNWEEVEMDDNHQVDDLKMRLKIEGPEELQDEPKCEQ